MVTTGRWYELFDAVMAKYQLDALTGSHAWRIDLDAPRFDSARASATLANQRSFKHSSRNLPVKLSTNAFSIA